MKQKKISKGTLICILIILALGAYMVSTIRGTAEKKEVMNTQYKDIPMAQDKDESAKEVELATIKRLDEVNFAGKYNIKVSNSSVTIEFNDSVHINKGELTALTREIYDYFTDAGLSRNDIEARKLSVCFIIEGQEFKSSWKLGELPKDDWN